MNTNVIAKQYAKLTARERAVLVLNAYGRNDRSEGARLLDASPRITLDAPDCGRIFHRLIAAIEWHALKQTGNAATLFLMMHLDDAQSPDDDDGVAVMAYNIITRADGWKLFCAELGLDPIGALRIADADEGLLEMAERVARGVNPDVNALAGRLRAMFPQLADVEPKTAEEVAAEYRAFLNVSK